MFPHRGHLGWHGGEARPAGDTGQLLQHAGLDLFSSQSFYNDNHLTFRRASLFLRNNRSFGLQLMSKDTQLQTEMLGRKPLISTFPELVMINPHTNNVINVRNKNSSIHGSKIAYTTRQDQNGVGEIYP